MALHAVQAHLIYELVCCPALPMTKVKVTSMPILSVSMLGIVGAHCWVFAPVATPNIFLPRLCLPSSTNRIVPDWHSTVLSLHAGAGLSFDLLPSLHTYHTSHARRTQVNPKTTSGVPHGSQISSAADISDIIHLEIGTEPKCSFKRLPTYLEAPSLLHTRQE